MESMQHLPTINLYRDERTEQKPESTELVDTKLIAIYIKVANQQAEPQSSVVEIFDRKFAKRKREEVVSPTKIIHAARTSSYSTYYTSPRGRISAQISAPPILLLTTTIIPFSSVDLDSKVDSVHRIVTGDTISLQQSATCLYEN
ncbi:hypothetical protein DFA_12323 [Cavenderia fasciculata]|uniref:Uncharacterized protein n=1 Tax=Cavenderia fasciculata TaxID=261658 RepID=F4QD76_CACFS|nr:uncharacterized protein DFA_12323 [Cavenderia fasciculata]EGG14547.1 hypothetical protein DFA_12323 [Cavenderia fasciculata]|eukprot:XP_004366067.1 hypothetical protein DFA_12323 [Cavenderia fasciculata]